MDGEEGPSPNAYNITTEIIDTVERKAPSYSFGVTHSPTKFISEAHEAVKFGQVRAPPPLSASPARLAGRCGQGSPGPSAYDALKPTPAPAFTFGAADRTERAKFISDSHTKENFGLHSPGPAHTGSLPASSLGGAPSQPFGTGKRAALHTKVRAHDAHHPGVRLRVCCCSVQGDYAAGPGSHEINRGMGDNRHTGRNPPKFRSARAYCRSTPPRYIALD